MPDICQIYALDISDRIACSAGPMAEDNKTSIMPSLATPLAQTEDIVIVSLVMLVWLWSCTMLYIR